ncbi:DUF2269 family protein [Bacillus haikouensis]|uniref:DUF2269 family protein n=1 Tax=Bacillus haikouensis TaxID=1510468 RepID=UPI0015534C86|nr:DUF2269 family protein [Bacillus haikouensis]NQD65899.1 DUF2269 family protein [Bacillus haikouensis]
MNVLILIHVLSAIVGIGPTFFAHLLTRPNKNVDELRIAMKYMKLLEFFPKIGGSISVLTGIALFLLGEYGAFTQIWLLGSLILYILIQIIVIGFITPSAKKVIEWLDLPENHELTGSPPEEIQSALVSIYRLFYLASSLGLLLFIFMILKP